jgi:AmiR/NasT family two-component response regulator
MSETAPLRVLLADDDDRARALLVEILIRQGFDVVADVANGRDAVAGTAEHQPDVVLLDVHMPDISGLDAAHQICEAQPAVAVVLFTGDEEVSLSDEQNQNGITLLPKMTSPNLLGSNLRGAVTKTRTLLQARNEAKSAKQAVEDRKKIERAKGLLMRRTGCSEQEAYKILQRSSQDRSQPMVAIAQAVLDSEPGAGSNGRS